MPTLLEPTAPIAERVIVVADPAVAMTLAVALTVKPLMANHAHGLWGYHGEGVSGGELSVQSHGAGSASAALVMDQLGGLGVKRVVKLGEAKLDRDGPFVPLSARCGDGISSALAGERVEADRVLAAALGEALGVDAAGEVSSHDPFTDPPGPAGAIDHESAAILALSVRHGIAAACALINPVRGEMLGGEAEGLGRAAVHALTEG